MTQRTPPCPECGGPLFCVGQSEVLTADDAHVDSYRCENHLECDGGLEYAPSTGQWYTMERHEYALGGFFPGDRVRGPVAPGEENMTGWGTVIPQTHRGLVTVTPDADPDASWLMNPESLERAPSHAEHEREIVTCGNCGRSWCGKCDPAPSALCHYCHGRGSTTAPVGRTEPTPEPPGIHRIDRALLTRIWRAVFNADPQIEDSGDEGPDGVGPEVWINDTIALWPFTTRGWYASVNTSLTDGGPLRWQVARMIPVHNYPHAPDDVDYEDGSEHSTLDAAISAAVALWADTALNGAWEALAGVGSWCDKCDPCDCEPWASCEVCFRRKGGDAAQHEALAAMVAEAAREARAAIIAATAPPWRVRWAFADGSDCGECDLRTFLADNADTPEVAEKVLPLRPGETVFLGGGASVPCCVTRVPSNPDEDRGDGWMVGPCSVCDGVGTIGHTQEPCDECDGSGRLWTRGLAAP